MLRVHGWLDLKYIGAPFEISYSFFGALGSK